MGAFHFDSKEPDMKNIVVAFVFSLLVTGCQTQPGVIHDPHMGNTIAYSQRYSVHGGLLTNAYAQAVYSTRKGYGLALSWMSTGMGWAFFREAWSQGRQYPYDVGQEKVLGCGGGCTLLETGAIRMTEAQFKTAAKQGFTYKLVGRNGSYVGTVKPEAFQQVLDQMRSGGGSS